MNYANVIVYLGEIKESYEAIKSPNNINLFYLLLFVYLFISFGCVCWVFVAVHGLSLVAASRGYSSLRCAGFSLRWLLLLQARALECTGFSRCGAWAQ